MGETVEVKPGDLYALLRIFYEKSSHYTQAERRAAERLNTALRDSSWDKDPRKSRY